MAKEVKDDKKSTSPSPKIGNAELAEQLAKFDYNKLSNEESLNDYLNLTIGKLTGKGKIEHPVKNPRTGGLLENDLYDYEGYRCYPLFEFTNPDDEKSPKYISGIKLMSTTPEIACTRITAGRAKLLNQQLPGYNGKNPGIYYFIKKVAAEVEAGK